MPTKEFLLQDCENIKYVLNDTLRYKYGLDGSKDFFNECESRLFFIQETIKTIDNNDLPQLKNFGNHLNSLSNVISRIERSSIGEYSWPFVEEFKEISVDICAEIPQHEKDKKNKEKKQPPSIHVLSGGGLDSYRIYTEPNEELIQEKKILTIVFPRSLKHYVLLHPILGHELGHAIKRNSEHSERIGKIIYDNFTTKDSLFESSNKTLGHIYAENTPKIIKEGLSFLERSQGINEDNFFIKYAKHGAWIEEIICDLVGLLSFGPSFVAALLKILYVGSPAGDGFDRTHPFVGWRVNMILQASKILKYDDINGLGDELSTLVTEHWKYLGKKKQNDDWYNIFTDEQLEEILAKITTLLDEYKPTLYQSHTVDILESLYKQILNSTPPVGFTMENGKVKCEKIDFRHILYIGWILKQHSSNIPFLVLNQLCEHAIMQQRGINLYLKQENGK